MSHYDRLGVIAKSLGLEPVMPADTWQAKTEKLIAILTAHIERANTPAEVTQRKPGRPRKE